MSKKVESFTEFKKELETNKELQNRFKENPVQAVQQFEQKNPLDTDPWIYRIIVLSLGITLLVIVVGVIYLMLDGNIKDDEAVPTIFTAIGSAAVGALAGLLGPSRRASNS